MAATFPTALQRTSDERWVTLDVVARDDDRAVARLPESPRLAAVVRLGGGERYDRHLRRLLDTPPPEPGRDVHMSWPVDLLHDLDVQVVGYTAPRHGWGRTFALADFVDPVRRAETAPLATRRHLLRVARNTATATAALHHAGHGGIRGEHVRIDERARVVLVRADELLTDVVASQRADDDRRLANLVVRLLGGQPWASVGDLAGLLRDATDPSRPPAPAGEWFHALREAERGLPATPAVRPAEPITPTVHRSLATALRDARGEGPASMPDPIPPRDPGAGRPRSAGGAAPRSDAPSDSAATTPVAGADTALPVGRPSNVRLLPASRDAGADPDAPLDPGSRPSSPLGGGEPDRGPLRGRADAAPTPAATPTPTPATTPAPTVTAIPRARRRRRSRPDGRHVRPDRRELVPAAEHVGQEGPARPAFALALGLTLGLTASVAPFAAFLAVAAGKVVTAAVDVGLRKSSRGPHQTVAIVLSRLLPFATGGLALAAFILLDLLLLLGLCMAIAERVFDYGPGFTLTWVLQLPEVPGLVRAFAFAVGAAGGLALGGPTYDRIRRGATGRRLITTPALAMALAAGILLTDAAIVWWPLPSVA